MVQKTTDNKLGAMAWVGAALWLALRLVVYLRYATRFTDIDQSLLWYATREILAGRFHEPCFYGQAYNSWFESLLAVPLMWAKIPIFFSLPAVTSLLTVVGFLFASDTLRRVISPRAAVFFIYLNLLLPLEFHLMTSMPRGFVTGWGVAMVGLWGVHVAKKEWALGLGCFFLAFGLALNPNVLFFILPWVLWHFEFFWALRLRVTVWMATLLGLFPYGYAKVFYARHPEYIVHKSDIFNLDLSNISLSWPGVYNNLPHLAPLGWAPVLLFMFAGALLAQFKDTWARRSLLVLAALFVFFLTLEKSFDGTQDIFLPLTRFTFCGVVFVFASLAAFLAKLRSRWILSTVCTSGVLVLANTLLHFERDLHKDVALAPAIFSVEQMVATCHELETIAQQQGVELFVFRQKIRPHVYSCPVISSAIDSLDMNYERRTWRVQKENEVPRSKFFISELNPKEKSDLEARGNSVEPLRSGYLVSLSQPLPVLKALEAVDIHSHRSHPHLNEEAQ